MAEEPPSNADIVAQFGAAQKEVTATAASREADAPEMSPARPERHPAENSPAWTDGPGNTEQVGRSALAWNRLVNERYATHNASIEAKSDPAEIAREARAREDAANQAREQDKGKDGNGR